jgi:hypothetical protein
MHFRQADVEKIPGHWRSFGCRASALTGGPRLAVNPANAVLNYLYTLLEAEARLALLAVGCDPGVGILHADEKARDSMACDVMEAVRPAVDRWFREYVAARAFRRQDFVELTNGQCRLGPAIASELAQTATRWAQLLAPVVEQVAGALYSHAKAPEQPRRWTLARRQVDVTRVPALPTPLTQARMREGKVRASALHRKTSEECTDGRSESNLDSPPRPALTRNRFLTEIMPALRDIPAKQIAARVGLSEAYCAKIRAGRSIPGRQHWDRFEALAR